MKVTREWLESKNACSASIDYVCERGYIGLEVESFIYKLMRDDRFSDANWLITRVLTLKQSAKYAIYAVSLALPVFESVYPSDSRLREAIDIIHKVVASATASARSGKTYTHVLQAARAVDYVVRKVSYKGTAREMAAANVALAVAQVTYVTINTLWDDTNSDIMDAHTAALYARSSMSIVGLDKSFEFLLIGYGLKFLKGEKS